MNLPGRSPFIANCQHKSTSICDLNSILWSQLVTKDDVNPNRRNQNQTSTVLDLESRSEHYYKYNIRLSSTNKYRRFEGQTVLCILSVEGFIETELVSTVRQGTLILCSMSITTKENISRIICTHGLKTVFKLSWPQNQLVITSSAEFMETMNN